MCKVARNGDGDELRFGRREWVGISIATAVSALVGGLASAGIVAGAIFYVVDLKIAIHSEKRDIHQTVAEKDRKWMPRSEFQTYVDTHERVEETQDDRIERLEDDQ